MTPNLSGPARRTVLCGAFTAAGLVVAGGALSGCAGQDTKSPAKAPTAPPGTKIGKSADVPVGGGKVFPDLKLVVTQPTEGDFQAFSAVCTHQGCLVSSVADGKIHCACHGSDFAIADGSVVHGPASAPLPAAKVLDDNGTLTFA